MEQKKIHMFTTENIPERHKLELWVEEFGRRLHAVDVTCQEQAAFHGVVESTSLGPMAITRYFGPAMTISRTGSLLGNIPKLRFHLMLTQAGCHIFSQADRSMRLESGSMVLVDSHQLFRNVKETVTDIRVVSLAETFANHWIPHIEDYVAYAFQGNHGWGAVLSAYIRNLSTRIAQAPPSTHYEQALIMEHVASLMSFAFKEVALPEREPAQTGRLRRSSESHRHMLLWLRQHYHESTITVQTMADAFGMSVRNVHYIFGIAGGGATFLDTLHTIRLEAVMRLLEKKDEQAMTLSEIGWRCGFPEQSHFCRMFRQHKKMSPGEYVRMLRLAEPKSQ